MSEGDLLEGWWDDARLLEAPSLEYDSERARAFREVIEQAHQSQVVAPVLDYGVPYPKYEFLCYLADCCGYMLHGSNDPGIMIFEPQLQSDAAGRLVSRVYATPDGIWPMFFAIIDRAAYRGSLRQRFVRSTDPDGAIRRLYRFSVNRDLLPRRPWRSGTVYILPSDAFEPTLDRHGQPTEEWASSVPLSPVAKLSVEPSDFPFLDQVEGHDDSALTRLEELQLRVLAFFDCTEAREDQWLVRLRPGRRVNALAAELTEIVNESRILADVTLALVDDGGPALRVEGAGARALVSTVDRLGPKIRLLRWVPGSFTMLLLLSKSSRGTRLVTNSLRRLMRASRR